MYVNDILNHMMNGSQHHAAQATVQRLTALLTDSEEHALSGKNHPYLEALYKWLDTMPKQCVGPDMEGCGNPQLMISPSANGECYQCQQTRFEKNPPGLTKREQNTFNRLETLLIDRKIRIENQENQRDLKDKNLKINKLLSAAQKKSAILYFKMNKLYWSYSEKQ